MLKSEHGGTKWILAWALILVVGVLAAILVAQGNAGNMGLCGACFLRDLSGSLGFLSSEKAPRIFRPELMGIMFGALAMMLARKKFVARSGSHAVTRFVLGMITAIGALVFLGCPFRMLQRLGGGDLNALVGLVGFLAGVFVATRFEVRGYNIGKTSPVTTPLGLLGHAVWVALGGAWIAGGVLLGPAFGDASGPPHAPAALALGVGLVAGAILSITGFCAVSAVRQLFSRGRKAMSVAALVLICGFAVTSMITGKFHLGFEGQPAAHQDALWNIFALALVGLSSALSGGCPVRQMVMSGEGNGDAFVTTMGILCGGAVAHNLGLASTIDGPTERGKLVVMACLVFVLVYAWLSTRGPQTSAVR